MVSVRACVCARYRHAYATARTLGARVSETRSSAAASASCLWCTASRARPSRGNKQPLETGRQRQVSEETSTHTCVRGRGTREGMDKRDRGHGSAEKRRQASWRVMEERGGRGRDRVKGECCLLLSLSRLPHSMTTVEAGRWSLRYWIKSGVAPAQFVNSISVNEGIWTRHERPVTVS